PGGSCRSAGLLSSYPPCPLPSQFICQQGRAGQSPGHAPLLPVLVPEIDVDLRAGVDVVGLLVLVLLVLLILLVLGVRVRVVVLVLVRVLVFVFVLVVVRVRVRVGVVNADDVGVL